jgi:hypothetical protein
MATESVFFSPGIKNLGTASDLRQAALAVSDVMAKRHEGDNPRPRLMIRPGHPEVYKDDPKKNDVVSDLIRVVRPAFPEVGFLLVERHMHDVTPDDPARTWHTDTTAGGADFNANAWNYSFYPMPREPKIMSINGPVSTQCAFGDIRIDNADIAEARLRLPSFRYLSCPTEQDISTEFGKMLERTTGALVGGVGQLVHWQDLERPNPDGDYGIVSLPEGYLGEMSPVTLHIPPAEVPAGRTLLYMM